MMKQPSAVPRALIWAALGVFALYSGISLAAGPGRESTFSDVAWTTSAIIQVLVVTAAIALVCGRAAYMTFRREIAPRPGAITFPGAPMSLFGEVFTALVGGLLLLLAVFMTLRIPESILVGAEERYRNYASVSIGPNLMIGVMFGGFGFLLLILRRYVWEVVPRRGLVRYWARAFGRGQPITKELRLYWTCWYDKGIDSRIASAWWLRAKDPASAGFFRDASLEFLPLNTPHAELDARIEQWRQRFSQLTEGRVAISMEPRPELV